MGFFPANLHTLSRQIVTYVGGQLSLNATSLPDYASREPTLYEHQQQILSHLNYRRATPLDLLTLNAWLLGRALEHDQPKHIFNLACDYLRRERIVRPGTTRLAKRVGQARSAASQITFERLTSFLTEERCEFLDGLLDTEGVSVSRLAWLQHTPKSNNTRAIVETLDKIAYLHQHNVGTWDLSTLNPNRHKWLAKKADGRKTRDI